MDFQFFKKKRLSLSKEKIFLTISLLVLYKLGHAIPLSGVTQENLQKFLLFFSKKKLLIQAINIYINGDNYKISPFSLGMVPYINASIILDLLTAIVPFLDKLQSEGGEFEKEELFLYKKRLTLILALIQNYFFVNYFKSYYYSLNYIPLFLSSLELICGSMMILWISNLIDTKGVGNGTSLIIFINIITNFFNKNFFNYIGLNSKLILEVLFLLILILLIYIFQISNITIKLISARQLRFFYNMKKKFLSPYKNSKLNLNENILLIKLNQSGIFPIIIISNLKFFFPLPLYKTNYLINIIFYYSLIIIFNYFYTNIFLDPKKISEELRKASVSIINIVPGKETISYLQNMVKGISLIGGGGLCIILALYDFTKTIIKSSFLNKINIISLMIIIKISYDLQKIIHSLIKIDIQEN